MKIIEVKDKTLGKSIGLKPGDRLLKINGKRVVDEIDYRFRITDEEILLDVEVDGLMKQFNVEKNYDDDLGVVFEEFKIRKCANDCIFCFVELFIIFWTKRVIMLPVNHYLKECIWENFQLC